MKPIIGLTVNVNEAKENSIYNSYVHAIEAAGGIAILLPYSDLPESIEYYTSLCDAFLFTGGSDVAPERYGMQRNDKCTDVEIFRDEYEFRLFDAVLKSQKPIMAICRGIQLINVALGGTLYIDIPSERPSDIAHVQKLHRSLPSHTVSVVKDTPLFNLINNDKMNANSFHHQCIKKLAPTLIPMAYADDGIIEAVYKPDHSYFRAYQWHPERLCDSEKSNLLLFKDLIEAAKNLKNS